MHSAAFLVAGLLLSAAPSAETLEQYADAASTVGHSPEANLRLALWCEKNGLEPEREKHLSMVILADPENAVARGLLGQVHNDGKWRDPVAVAERLWSDPAMIATLKEYAKRRDETPKTAVDQYKLALWCEKQGLKSEATAHLTSVVRLQPNNESARKRLGYKKRDGQWLTDEQIATLKHKIALQLSADAHWKPILTNARRGLSNRNDRAKVERELGSVNDPRAVPMIMSVLGKKEPSQTLQLLGQIDSPDSSRALSFLAIFGKSPELRRIATETLRLRDPREWAGSLISLLADPISYEFKQGTGPDGADELFIEGERFDRKRIYKSPKAIDLQETDRFVGLDSNGLPIFERNIGEWQSPFRWISDDSKVDAILQTKHAIKSALIAELSMGASMAADAYPELTSPTLAQRQNFVQDACNALGGAVGHETAQRLANLVNPSPQATQFSRMLYQYQWNARAIARAQALFNSLPPIYQVADVGEGYELIDAFTAPTYGPGGTLVTSHNVRQARFSPIAAEMGRKKVEQAKQDDIAQLESFNRAVEARNRPIVTVLDGATGQRDVKPTRTDWQRWWVDQIGYRSLALRTDAGHSTRVEVIEAPKSLEITDTATHITRISCFGAGTLVKTLDGARRIESIAVGDRVLSQDPETGTLSYQPVLVVHHNPPSATLKVKVGDEAIVASTFHRFWVAGHGWKMARELKAGDPIRTLHGREIVANVEPEKVQPVFNLDVAGGHTFFVGKRGTLVHDNGVPGTRDVVFDAVDDVPQTTVKFAKP